MSLFTFQARDQRQQRLSDALAALVANPDPLLNAELSAEQTALAASDWRTSDRTFQTFAEDWTWRASAADLQAVRADPALRALGQDAQITDDQLAALTAVPRAAGAVPINWFSQVRAALGEDEAALTELLFTAHRLLAANPYPYDDVGVLLPLRLETLFDAPNTVNNPDPAQWRLLLRVVPDDVAISRANSSVSAGEHAALERFWNAAAPQPLAPPAATDTWLESDAGQVAWGQFCADTSPARAAWLAANFTAELDPGGARLNVTVPPEQLGAALEPNRVAGMPPRLGVWAVVGGAAQQIGSLPLDPDAQIDPNTLTLALPSTLAGEQDARASWLVSWDQAKKVGLGGEWLLPAGATPQSIEALYVFGLGEDQPAAQFRALAASGELGTAALGAATNTVHGQPAANLATDPDAWRAVAGQRIRAQTAAPSTRLAQLLTGDAAAIPAFPMAADETNLSHQMVQALWPALWGNWLRAVWQVGEERELVANWAFTHLYPEGPLPALRVAEQPYGLLPVTALSQWQADADARDPQRAVEERMAAALTQLRAQWAVAGQRGGTVVGSASQQFLDLLGRAPNTGSYVTRALVDPLALALAFNLNGQQQAELRERASELYRAAEDAMQTRIPTPYLALGNPVTRQLPLVQPRRMLWRATPNRDQPERVPLTALLEQLLQGTTIEQLFEKMDRMDRRWHALPNSLLIRLLVYACQLNFTWQAPPLTPDAQRVLDVQAKAALRLAERYFDNQAWWQEVRHPITGQPRYLTTLPDAVRQSLERALRATLDSATHRLDPWVTAFAWQRLKRHSASPRSNYRLGAYGWLDGPFLGQPGPTNAGRLHAPSYSQALAGLVLRDGYLTAGRELLNPADRNRWHMDIESRRARLAQEIADEVRLGFNIHEIAGRRVEQVIANHQQVKALRMSADYAMDPANLDPNTVCDGVRALYGLLTGNPEIRPNPGQLRLELNDAPGADARFPLTVEQVTSLKMLCLALNTYGDLLLADGIMQLTNRQPERAAETMDAAAGFSRPPTFEFIRTPPSGYFLESRALTVLPYVPVEAVDPAAGPLLLAEPSLVSFIQRSLPQPWTWTVATEAGPVAVTLADLGLDVLDTLALSNKFLSDLVRLVAGVPDGAVEPPAQHRIGRQLLTLLGNRPAAGRDFAASATAYSAQDALSVAELSARYAAVTQAALDTLALFAAAADDLALAGALRAALRWGIAPVAAPQDERALLSVLAGTPPPADATPLVELAARARAALQARLDASPAAPLTTLPALTGALGALATSDGKLSITARWEQADLVAQTNLQLAQPEADLENTWLTTVAAVRPPLARLEALQLEAQIFGALPPLSAWSSSPGDPWQTALVQQNAAAREAATPIQIAHTPFVAAFGSADAWGGAQVAVAMLDSFNEAIPMPQRSTTVAFGFNAPAARAPQALLLAVPPAPKQRLDDALLLQILIETRELTRARAARLEDLDAYQALAPATGLRTSGSPRARLEPRTLYD